MVRLISEDGQNKGFVQLNKALEYAVSKGLDLVQMNTDATPVCKVMNYGKHVFHKKKVRRHQHRSTLKEIKFRVGTETADYQVKLRKLRNFLEHGDKTKVSLRFRGRELSHQELGLDLLNRVKKDLENWGKVEQEPELERMQLSMVFTPNLKKRVGGNGKPDSADSSAGDSASSEPQSNGRDAAAPDPVQTADRPE